MFIAHRGLFDDNIKENTIEAFDNAFNNGYEGIEFDVRLTKDKIPVILHDSFLSRVFGVKGLLKNYTYQELLDNKIEIPKFEDVISRYNNKVMIIELKEKIDITKYIKDTGNHVLYRVTPVFEGNNLVATGVEMEAYSVEDNGKGIKFNVFVYNIEDGVIIDYKTGDNKLAS